MKNEEIQKILQTNDRIKKLFLADPELLNQVKWLCWNAVENTTKTIHKDPLKIITREISDNWMEYEAGLTEKITYNPYL